MSATRDVPGQGPIPVSERIDSRILVDIAAYCDVKDGIRLHIKADNVLDKIYVAGRRPYGVRPGKSRETFVGVGLEF